ncbi:restriction endonuclease subunit S [Mycobacterium sp. MUNTM1]
MSLSPPQVLPEGWELSRIGDRFASWGGHTPSKSNADYWGHGIPWVSSGEVKAARLSSSTHSVTRKAVDETGLKVCPIGCVLVVVRSGILAHSLPVAIADSPVTINQDMKAFYSEEPLLNEWLALFLRASAQALLQSSRRDGTTVQSVQYALLKDTLLPIPPVTVRKPIIDTIERAIEKQSSARPHIETSQRVVERFRQSVLAAACSGRLTDDVSSTFDFDCFEREVELARTSLSPKLRKPLTIDDSVELSEIPVDWKWMTIDQLTIDSIQNGLYLPATRYGTGVPILRIEDFQLGASRSRDELKLVSATPDEQRRFALNFGDLVVNRVNSPSHLGKSLYVETRHVPAVFESNMMRVRLKAPMSARYVNLYLSSLNGRRRLTRNAKWAVNQASINQKDVRECPVPVPPPDEQHEIVRRVEDLFAGAGRLTTRLDTVSKRVDRISQAVLAKAFRGELLTK